MFKYDTIKKHVIVYFQSLLFFKLSPFFLIIICVCVSLLCMVNWWLMLYSVWFSGSVFQVFIFRLYFLQVFSAPMGQIFDRLQAFGEFEVSWIGLLCFFQVLFLYLFCWFWNFGFHLFMNESTWETMTLMNTLKFGLFNIFCSA